MICPVCKAEDSRVAKTSDGGRLVTRNRRCDRCASSWVTHERIDEDSVIDRSATGGHPQPPAATGSRKPVRPRAATGGHGRPLMAANSPPAGGGVGGGLPSDLPSGGEDPGSEDRSGSLEASGSGSIKVSRSSKRSARARSDKPAAAAEQDAALRKKTGEVIAWFCEAWRAARGAAYQATPKDAGQVKLWLKTAAPTDVESLPGQFARYVRDRDAFWVRAGHGLALFFSEGYRNRLAAGIAPQNGANGVSHRGHFTLHQDGDSAYDAQGEVA